MPVVAVKGAVIVVTVVAAAAIAIYESPEVRQFAEQCRRRIAIALHSLGDEINPRSASQQPQEPRYNRPEDAEGFLQSGTSNGVDADEESRRRQREELMYWNAVRLEKMKENEQSKQKNRSRGSSFDDFLSEDPTAEKGTYIYNTGADVHGDSKESHLRRRRDDARRADRDSAFSNPFADENQIEQEIQQGVDKGFMSPNQSEFSEDLYGVSDDGRPIAESIKALAREEQLVDISEPASAPVPFQPPPQELPAEPYYQESYMINQDGESAFASIHAWADDSHHAGFYSPLPVTPPAPLSVASEPEELGGQITPTDSVSLADSGEDVGREDASSVEDVMSEDDDGIHTPGSWTEVGSVVSGSDAGHRV